MKTRIFVMRHGDRADDSDAFKDLVDRPFDPPLSPMGIKTTERVVNERLHEIDAIFSSPFLRCVQTAAVAQNLLNVSSCIIDSGIIEVWHPRVLKSRLCDILLRTDAELLQFVPRAIFKHGFQSLPFVINDEGETQGIGGSADQRFRSSLTRIAIDAANSGYRSILVVTHGDCINSVGEMAGKDIYSVDYCGLIVVDFIDSSWQFVDSFGIGILDF